jgi:hypothetical protein
MRVMIGQPQDMSRGSVSDHGLSSSLQHKRQQYISDVDVSKIKTNHCQAPAFEPKSCFKQLIQLSVTTRLKET